MINEKTVKTSEQWGNTISHVQLLNHDGWKHGSFKEFYYGWFEESITEREFFKRLSNSTIRIKK